MSRGSEDRHHIPTKGDAVTRVDGLTGGDFEE
jgi:hypothetical protein